MIEYVYGENPDDRVLQKASEILKSGGLVCFPTDTHWIVACDPFQKKGVDSLYRFKEAPRLKHFSLFCDTISRASEYALIDDHVYRLIRGKVPGHYTFIFEALKKITKAVQASKTDREVGVRFVPSTLVSKLIAIHDGVLLTSHIDHDEEIYSYQIEEKYGNQIGLIIDPGELEFVGPSTIINFSQGEVIVERLGHGNWP